MREIPLANGKGTALVDDADYEWLSRFRWRANSHGYAITSSQSVYMHRLVLGLGKGEEGDHINGDKRDNRRENLRRCDRAQNMWNCPVPKGTSGFRGVWYEAKGRRRARFAARLRVRGRVISLGIYHTGEEAARAYDDAARRYHGEFARLNFPRDGEQAA